MAHGMANPLHALHCDYRESSERPPPFSIAGTPSSPSGWGGLAAALSEAAGAHFGKTGEMVAPPPELSTVGALRGEYNFAFNFRLDGGSCYQSGVLVASATTNNKSSLPIPLKCSWYRRVGEMLVQIPGVTTNMYQISADDVGTDIVVEAQPADEDDSATGIALGQLGPFELDPGTRRRLDDALGRGYSRFQVVEVQEGEAWETTPLSSLVRLRSNGSAASQAELTIEVLTGGLRVVPGVLDFTPGACKAPGAIEDFTPDLPRVILHPLHNTRLQLITRTRTHHLEASSRTARDLIAVTVRCFHSQRFMPQPEILQSIPVQSNDIEMDEVNEAPSLRNVPLETYIGLETLMSTVVRQTNEMEALGKVSMNARREKTALQAQLVETISGFTDLIEELTPQLAEGARPSAAGEASVQRIRDQIASAVDEKLALEQEQQRTRRELEQFRKSSQECEQESARRSGFVITATKKDVADLQQKLAFLQARHEELRSSVAQWRKDPPDQNHMKELKRLRRDIENLNDEQEDLRTKLRGLEREKPELQENFLFVKSHLDKVQMKQAHAATTGVTDGSAELQRILQSTGTVAEERSRFAATLEARLRDCEREKAYKEQSLDRAVSASGRLRQEKERAEDELRRVSELYAVSVQDLSAREEEEVDAAEAPDGPCEDPLAVRQAQEDEIGELRRRLDEVNEDLGQKDQENEALKNRIRKLATGG